MKELDIHSGTVNKWKAASASKTKVEQRPNLLKQDFSTTGLNQKWTADMTYIQTKRNGWCYLSTIMDLHSRRIIGYSFSKKMATDLVLKTLESAVKNRTITGDLIIHTDLGSQYTSDDYNQRLTELHIRHSYSRKGVQLRAVMQNRPYILALIGQVLFGFTLYGRNADVLYYFTYVEGNASYYTTYSMCIIIPSIIGAACFQPVFRKLNNKGRTASIFALLTGISMLCMFFFNVKETPAAFYTLAGITQFFFSGFNTAIYAIIPDCVEYGEWKTGLRNDGFQYAFVSLGNKIGMAIGTALLAALLGKYGYVANQVQNPAVLSIMRHSFTTIPGVLWIVTAIVLFFYRLNKKRYNEIVEDLKKKRVK